MAGGLQIDLSDIDRLEGLIAHAANTAPKDSAQALEKRTREAFTEAKANAGSFHKASTGELASVVEMEVIRGEHGIIRAPVRQGFFLEYGSPKTGAPRPWLTGPARDAAERLVRDMGDAGSVW